MKHIIVLQSRFPAKVIGDHMIHIEVPCGPDGVRVLSEEFIENFKLSKTEVNAAEYEALKAVVIEK